MTIPDGSSGENCRQKMAVIRESRNSCLVVFRTAGPTAVIRQCLNSKRSRWLYRWFVYDLKNNKSVVVWNYVVWKRGELENYWKNNETLTTRVLTKLKKKYCVYLATRPSQRERRYLVQGRRYSLRAGLILR